LSKANSHRYFPTVMCFRS